MLTQGSEGNAPPGNLRHMEEYQGRGSAVDDGGITTRRQFFTYLHKAVAGTNVRNEFGETVDLEDSLKDVQYLCRATHAASRKVILIGNGGSAAIASHMATDWTKNGQIRSIAFNDAPTLTCLANDFGYENVFSKQLEYYGAHGDVVIIISSSGKSENILRAAEQAVGMSLNLITFSGMNPENTLRKWGRFRFYTPALDYGIVEIAHLSLLHSVVSVTDR